MPSAVPEATARLTEDVPAPGAAIDVGLKLTVTPLGWPDADSATAWSKPSRTVVVTVAEPLLPCTTETAVGETARVKVGDVAVGASALINPVPLGLPHPVTRS